MNKNGSKILSNDFIGEISKVFNWQYERDKPKAVPGERIFNKTLSAKTYSDCNSKLKDMRSDNINKLLFAHLNINSIRNKFEIQAQQVKEKTNISMISETKNEESFPQGNFLIDRFNSHHR